MSNLGYILAAYLAAGVIASALILWIALAGLSLRRTLAALEAQGVRRRSAGKDGKEGLAS